MKIYDIVLNAEQPIHKCVAVPANTQKFGLVVKAEGIEGDDVTCSMVDGATTTEAVKQANGDYLFTMSSIGEDSHEVKIVLESAAKNIGGLSTEWTGMYAYIDWITLPAGKYVVGDLVKKLAALGETATMLTHYLKPANEYLSNLVGFTQIAIAPNGDVGLVDSSGVIPADTEVEVLEDTTFRWYVRPAAIGQPDSPCVSPDLYFGESVTSYHDVTLNETRYAMPDGEIEVQDPDIVVDSVTIDGETYPVEWRAITIDGEPVVVLAAKVETPESSDSELDSTDTELDSNDSELIGD